MAQPKIFANTVATVGVIAYLICLVLSVLFPDLVFGIGQSWFHTFNLSSVKANGVMDFGSSLLGAVTLGVYLWIISYFGSWLYKKWS